MMTMSMMGVATRRTVEAVRHRSRYLRQTPASRKIQNSASPAMMNSSIGYLAQMCELLLTLSRPTLLMMPRPLFGSRPPLIRLGLDGAARLRMLLRSVSLVRCVALLRNRSRLDRHRHRSPAHSTEQMTQAENPESGSQPQGLNDYRDHDSACQLSSQRLIEDRIDDVQHDCEGDGDDEDPPSTVAGDVPPAEDCGQIDSAHDPLDDRHGQHRISRSGSGHADEHRHQRAEDQQGEAAEHEDDSPDCPAHPRRILHQDRKSTRLNSSHVSI